MWFKTDRTKKIVCYLALLGLGIAVVSLVFPVAFKTTRLQLSKNNQKIEEIITKAHYSQIIKRSLKKQQEAKKIGAGEPQISRGSHMSTQFNTIRAEPNRELSNRIILVQYGPNGRAPDLFGEIIVDSPERMQIIVYAPHRGLEHYKGRRATLFHWDKRGSNGNCSKKNMKGVWKEYEYSGKWCLNSTEGYYDFEGWYTGGPAVKKSPIDYIERVA